MEGLLRDLRIAVRTLGRSPLFAIVAVVTLGVGIGATAAVYSIMHAVLVRPLPYASPDRLAVLWEQRQKEGTSINGVTGADYVDWERETRVFASLTAHDLRSFSMTGEGDAERLFAVLATPNATETYGMRPVVGRAFAASDVDRRVMLLGHGVWKRRFGGDPGIVGRTIRLDDQAYEVIGVLPPDFRLFYGRRADIWLPLALPVGRLNRNSHDFLVVGRLRDGVTWQTARAEMAAISKRIEAADPANNSGHSANVLSLEEQVRGEWKPALTVLGAAVSLVLLLACANVANLYLARWSAKERELAMRRALGATQGQLMRMTLVESVVVSLLGGALGVGLAWGAITVMKSMLPEMSGPVQLPGIDRLGIDWPVLGLVSAITLGIGVLFGTLPAWGRATRVDRGARGLRNGLVVSEIAMASGLLVSALLLAASFAKLMAVPPGFETARRMSAQVELPESRYSNPQRQRTFYRGLLEELRRTAGVERAALSTYLPGSMANSRTGIRIAGRPEARTVEDALKVSLRWVSEGFFETMGIGVLRGRSFRAADDERAPLVVIVNQRAVAQFWNGVDPVGEQIAMFDGKPRTIVGVVGDTRYQGRDQDTAPELYLPLGQLESKRMTLAIVVRTLGDPAGAAESLRRLVARFDPSMPVSEMRTMDEVLALSSTERRFQTTIFTILAGVALILAGTGLYGLLTFVVAERTREIAIRMALGSQRSGILAMVLGRGLRLAIAGIAVGTLGAAMMAGFLRSLLFGVEARDPLMYGVATLAMVVVAVAACAAPAWRASGVDPMVALRAE